MRGFTGWVQLSSAWGPSHPSCCTGPCEFLERLGWLAWCPPRAQRELGHNACMTCVLRCAAHVGSCASRVCALQVGWHLLCARPLRHGGALLPVRVLQRREGRGRTPGRAGIRPRSPQGARPGRRQGLRAERLQRPPAIGAAAARHEWLLLPGASRHTHQQPQQQWHRPRRPSLRCTGHQAAAPAGASSARWGWLATAWRAACTSGRSLQYQRQQRPRQWEQPRGEALQQHKSTCRTDLPAMTIFMGLGAHAITITRQHLLSMICAPKRDSTCSSADVAGGRARLGLPACQGLKSLRGGIVAEQRLWTHMSDVLLAPVCGCVFILLLPWAPTSWPGTLTEVEHLGLRGNCVSFLCVDVVIKPHQPFPAEHSVSMLSSCCACCGSCAPRGTCALCYYDVGVTQLPQASADKGCASSGPDPCGQPVLLSQSANSTIASCALLIWVL